MRISQLVHDSSRQPELAPIKVHVLQLFIDPMMPIKQDFGINWRYGDEKSKGHCMLLSTNQAKVMFGSDVESTFC
jgi:hypothetical protein